MRPALIGLVFHTLEETRIPIDAWRRHYNTFRQRSGAERGPPVPETSFPPVDQQTRRASPCDLNQSTGAGQVHCFRSNLFLKNEGMSGDNLAHDTFETVQI